MQKRLLRYLGALLVSIVTTYSGFQRMAVAETTGDRPCSLSDVSAWRVSLEPAHTEATPAYIQRVTEDFIARCPARPETPEAHRIAAMAASWRGMPEAAAEHFDQAGLLRDAETLMMHAAARLALGQDKRAWTLRDRAVETWLARTLRREQARIHVTETGPGRLIAVDYDLADKDQRISRLWIAIPNGAGWPAALSISSERHLNALFRLRAGEGAAPLHHVRLYRCDRRRLLARTEESMTGEAIAETAELALSAYLADPDIPEAGTLSPCLFTNAIFPDIRPSSAVALQ